MKILNAFFRGVARFFGTLPLFIIAAGAWLISASFNLRTGYDMAHGDHGLMLTFMGLALVGDIGKAWSAANLRRDLSSRQFLNAVISTLVLAICLTMSLYAAYYQRAKAIDQEKAARHALIERHRHLQQEIASTRTELAQLGTVKSVQKAESELAIFIAPNGKPHRRWKSSEQCTFATVAASKRFCAKVAGLQAQRDNAIKAQTLRLKLAELQRKLDALPPLGQVDPAHKGIRDLAVRLGADENITVQEITAWIMIIITVFAEALSTLLPMRMASGRKGSRPYRPWFPRRWQRRRAPAPAPIVPADGRRLSRKEAFDWLANRACNDERVSCDTDGAIEATNAMLAKVWGRAPSTVNDWLTAWNINGQIEKKATARGTRIRVLV